MLISIQCLLKLAQKSDILCADFTFKTNLHLYPIFVMGTSERVRVSPPLAIGVCSGESAEDWELAFGALGTGVLLATGNIYKPCFLMADAAPAAIW